MPVFSRMNAFRITIIPDIDIRCQLAVSLFILIRQVHCHPSAHPGGQQESPRVQCQIPVRSPFSPKNRSSPFQSTGKEPEPRKQVRHGWNRIIAKGGTKQSKRQIEKARKRALLEPPPAETKNAWNGSCSYLVKLTHFPVDLEPHRPTSTEGTFGSDGVKGGRVRCTRDQRHNIRTGDDREGVLWLRDLNTRTSSLNKVVVGSWR